VISLLAQGDPPHQGRWRAPMLRGIRPTNRS